MIIPYYCEDYPEDPPERHIDKSNVKTSVLESNVTSAEDVHRSQSVTINTNSEVKPTISELPKQ